MRKADQTTLWTSDQALEPVEAFRPIHYLGSKLRFVDDIATALNELDPAYGTVCDLFAGSGTVAGALSHRRTVIAVDIQEYSRVLCGAVLNPPDAPESLIEITSRAFESEFAATLEYATAPLIEYEEAALKAATLGSADLLAELLDHGSIEAFAATDAHWVVGGDFSKRMTEVRARLRASGLHDDPRSVLTRFYGGLYFSYAQAARLDALRASAVDLVGKLRDSILAIALSSASDVVNTVGKHFAQPVRLRKRDGSIKASLVGKVRRDRSLDVKNIGLGWAHRYAALQPSNRPHVAVRADFESSLREPPAKVSVVYADPPYTRDHYSRYYHILETIARGDTPTLSASNLVHLKFSRGLYRSDRYQSPFCIRSQAPRAFASLFSAVRHLDAALVLSYSPFDSGSHPRMLTIDDLVASARNHFAEVQVRSIGRFAHSKLNSSDRTLAASDEAELLVLCRPS
jgi:16S rRNA G966 N2-methylase RsmD